MTINGQLVATAPYADIGLPDQHKLMLRNTNWRVDFKQSLNYLQKPCQISADGPAGTAFNANFTVAGIAGDGTVNLD
jgi:hypothetical protein